MLQGIMERSSESESDDDDDEGDEDEAKKPATSDKPKRSRRDKERRKNRRKLESTLKDELSIVSTVTEVQGQEMTMMTMKHVNLTVQGDREVPRQGRSEQGEDRENTTTVRCETPHRGKLQPVPKHPKTDAVVQQGQADGMAIRSKQLPRTSIQQKLPSRTRQPRSRASARSRNVPV